MKTNHDQDLLTLFDRDLISVRSSSYLPGLEFCRFRSRGFHWGGHYGRLHRLLLRLLWTWYPKCSQRIDPVPGTSKGKKKHNFMLCSCSLNTGECLKLGVSLIMHLYNVHSMLYLTFYRLCIYSTAIQHFPIFCFSRWKVILTLLSLPNFTSRFIQAFKP